MEPDQRAKNVAINKDEMSWKSEQLFDIDMEIKSGMCFADFCLALVDSFFFMFSPLMFGKVIYMLCYIMLQV